MSSIGSVGFADPSQFLRGIGGNSGAGRASGRMPEPSAEMKAQFESKFKDTANSLGLDGDKLSSIGGQIRDAVKSVTENSKGSSSDDVRSSIDSVINDVLKKNGIDKDEFQSDMSKIMDKMGVPKPGQGGFGGGGGFSSSVSGSSTNSQQQLLEKLLSSLSSGSKHGSSGSTNDLASFFSNAPAGTFVDAAA